MIAFLKREIEHDRLKTRNSREFTLLCVSADLYIKYQNDGRYIPPFSRYPMVAHFGVPTFHIHHIFVNLKALRESVYCAKMSTFRVGYTLSSSLTAGVDAVEERLQLLQGGSLAQRHHHCTQLGRRDEAVRVAVKHTERLVELCNIFRSVQI